MPPPPEFPHLHLYAALWKHVTAYCDFRRVPDPEAGVDRLTWTCYHDLKAVTRFCTQAGIPPDPVRRFCHDHGGYCDCEVLFNMNPKNDASILQDFLEMLEENHVDVEAALENWRSRERIVDGKDA